VVDFLGRLGHLQFDTSAQVWGYLFQACRNRLVTEHRRRRTDPPVDELVLDDEEQVIELREIRQLCHQDAVVKRLVVDDVLLRLTNEQREILTLRYLEDLTIDEVARRTDRTSAAVKALQRRGLRAAARIAIPGSTPERRRQDRRTDEPRRSNW
ncbi:MAG: sigma-70 family RNA polymerase sigma factor, partial [Actinomycetota bacterium]